MAHFAAGRVLRAGLPEENINSRHHAKSSDLLLADDPDDIRIHQLEQINKQGLLILK